MRFASSTLKTALAAEYLLGNLSARAQRRFERALTADAGIQAEVELWRRRLDGLSCASALEPPPAVWLRVERDVDRLAAVAEHRQPSSRRHRRSLRAWQASAGIAASAALVFAVQLHRETHASAGMTAGSPDIALDDHAGQARPPPEASGASFTTEPGGYGTRTLRLPREDSARWRVAYDAGSRRLSVQSIGYPWIDASEDYEVWWLDGDEIVPVGLLPRNGAWQLTMPRQTHVSDASRLVITREPAFGSHADGPTGPVLVNTLLRARS